LPEGEWVNLFSGKKENGGKWLNDFEVPLDEMPVWVKANAKIPFYPELVNSTDDMDFKKVITMKTSDSFKGIFNFLNEKQNEIKE
jgi:alpha-D-xyloside xylohydrolase